jgi:dihydropteroate synthase
VDLYERAILFPILRPLFSMNSFIFHFRRKTYDLSKRTLIMGVVNITPDSFSDGGLFYEREAAVKQGKRLAAEGADILDIGGESTRPGSKPIVVEEEMDRVIPVIEELSHAIDIPISVDTRRSEVAEKAIQAGAEIINDISALRFNPQMAKLCAERHVPVVLMHMQGEPETMQVEPCYDNILKEISDFFKSRIAWAESQGIGNDQIILDPGIGFGKSLDQGHNLMILKNLQAFKILGKPILVGPSRKSFIGKILGLPPQEREEGSLAAVVASILNGANIVRVHEVKKMSRGVRVADAILHAPAV